MLLVEAGILEQQALLLCESIRQFVGDRLQAPITVISPRPDRRPSEECIERLSALNARYVPLALESPCPEYGPAFRVLASAYFERHSSADTLVVLDSDTVFLRPVRITLGQADAAARPVDVKGMCTSGAADPMDDYWHKLCACCDVDYRLIPTVTATVDNSVVKASYNAGFVVVRRAAGSFQRAEDYFLRSVRSGLRPYAGSGTRVQAGTGTVSIEGSSYWGSSQACLSLAVWGSGLSVQALPSTYNFPLHCYDRFLAEIRSGELGDIAHVHYHQLFFTAPDIPNPILNGEAGFPAHGVAWLREKLQEPRSKRGQAVETWNGRL
jgi:hypothetical protein